MAAGAATEGSSSPVPVAAVAGGACGLVLLIVAVAAAVVGRRRAQHRGYAQGVNGATRGLAVAEPPPAANAVDDII